MRQCGKGVVPILILTLLACPLESVQAGDRVLVDRREKGYRLRASNAWKVQQAPQGIDSAISMENPQCSLNVVRVRADGLDEITADHLEAVFQKSAPKYSSQTFVKQKLETHRGKPSGWYEFTGELKQAPGLVLHFRQYLTLHRGYLYVITVWSPETSWQKSERHWQRVVRSMEFL